MGRVMRKMPNWKAPGPDNVQGYWLKNLTPLHDKLIAYLQDCLDSGVVPDWLIKGRTVLIQKDKAKGNIASNYRPITCLPLVWKLLTGILEDKIHDYLENNILLLEERKGCRRKCKRTGDLLFIDKMILREVRMRKKNLAVAWIDYKKAYDMVPHSWIVECLGMVGVSEQIEHFLSESMKTWRVDLTCNNQSLGGVDIKREIFQGDSLSPLLFVLCLIPLHKSESAYQFSSNKEKINHLFFFSLNFYAKNEKGLESLVQTVQIFSDDIGMELGIDKCGTLVLKRRKIAKFDGISLPD